MKYIIPIYILLSSFTDPPAGKIHIHGFAQGTTWMITYYAEDSIVYSSQIDTLLNVIDSSMSLYKSYSLINQFNTATSGIKVDRHFINVINRSVEAYYATKGAFDITYKSKCIGSDKLIIRGDSLIKTEPCVVIDVNGIAQGYSVDVISAFLLANNIKEFIVELGGEIRVEGRTMKIGIESPADNDSPNPFIQKIISIKKGAITTSGNYRKKDHVIDPMTGLPAANELVSVTVYAKDAITADAYDNALLVMGLKRATRFVRKRKDMAAYFIYRDKNGAFRSLATKRFKKLLVE